MRKTRILFLAMVVALATAARADAQLGIGGHVVRATDAFDGTTGLGARITVGVPLFPVRAAINGEYFFADCSNEDCSLWGATFDVNYSFPLVLVQPWAGVGWSIRNVEGSGKDDTERGLNIGAGLQLQLAAIRPYIDIRYELADAPEKQYLVRVGLMIR